MNRNARISAEGASVSAVANRLHSAAIHLLRRIRETDKATGLSPSRLSVLSVLVFGQSCTISELAEAEQVTVPSMSRLVAALEMDGLVQRQADPGDRRAVLISATAAGARILLRGRRDRVDHLARLLGGIGERELRCLGQAADIIERVMPEE